MTEMLVLGFKMMQNSKCKKKIQNRKKGSMRVHRVDVKYKFPGLRKQLEQNPGEVGDSRINNLQEVRGLWRPLLPSVYILCIV